MNSNSPSAPKKIFKEFATMGLKHLLFIEAYADRLHWELQSTPQYHDPYEYEATQTLEEYKTKGAPGFVQEVLDSEDLAKLDKELEV